MNASTWRRTSWILLLSAIVLTACGSEASPTPEESGIPLVVDDPAVIVEGRLKPIDSVRLSFKAPGEIGEVLVEEGATVEAGEVLVRLADGERLRAEVAAAEFELASARQALDTLYDNAPLIAAEAQLEWANAQDALDDAERERRYQQEGNRASSTTIDAAEAELALAKEGKKRAEKIARSCGSSHDPDCAQEYKDFAAAVQREWRALASLNWYTGHPTDIQQAILDAEVTLAQAQATEAEQKWKAWSQGPDPDELAVAKARLSNAQAQLQAAEAALSDLEILAPLSGTVASLPVKEGELVAAGQLGVVLADFSGWRIDTDNLTEMDIPQITESQPVEVTFDALPEVTLSGFVSAISPYYELKSGDVTYVVEIELREADPAMEWGMTAVVKFGESSPATAKSNSTPARMGH